MASILRKSRHGVRLNEHLKHLDAATVFAHACKTGLGIVSKRLGSRYRSGRSPDWLKFKNPEALLDGMTQSCRDTMLTVLGAAQFLKRQNPHSEVIVKDLQSGEVTPVGNRSQQR